MKKIIIFLLFIININAYEGWTQMATPHVIKPKPQPLTALQLLQSLQNQTTQ